MALADDFGLHVSLHTDALQTLRNGVPSGLSGQFAEVGAVLAALDADFAKIENDTNLTDTGKAAKLRAAHEQAAAAVGKWKTSKTIGIDSQITAHRGKLQAHADKLAPAPSPFQVRNMGERLAAFDPLEVEVLYANATDAERRIIEAAAEALGRQPQKRGEQLTWEPLIPAGRVSEVTAARLERADPQGAAALRDLERIRSTYEGLAGAAQALLRDSLPGYTESGPLV